MCLLTIRWKSEGLHPVKKMYRRCLRVTREGIGAERTSRNRKLGQFVYGREKDGFLRCEPGSLVGWVRNVWLSYVDIEERGCAPDKSSLDRAKRPFIGGSARVRTQRNKWVAARYVARVSQHRHYEQQARHIDRRSHPSESSAQQRAVIRIEHDGVRKCEKSDGKTGKNTRQKRKKKNQHVPISPIDANFLYFSNHAKTGLLPLPPPIILICPVVSS